MDISKPHLAVALACDSVIIGKDDVPSLIRLVDRYNVEANVEPPFPLKITLFTTFRPGRTQVQHLDAVLSRRLEGGSPAEELQRFKVVFKSGASGANVIFQMMLPFGQPGQYWFEIATGGELMGAIPVQVVKKGQNSPT